MTHTEILTLCGEKSIIRPNLPLKLGVEAVNRIMLEETHESIGKFGLFDSSSPNYTTYYPDVSAADLNPSDAEFIYPVYRLLSKVVIAPHNMAIDFTSGDVLKKSMPLLVGQSVMVDHEMQSGNILGVIQNTYWQEEYTTNDGVKVPAGINGILKIDGKANPRLARLIMMDPPALHSSSVTVKFGWEKSHKDVPDDQFMQKLGTFDDKGTLYSKKVSKIMMYYENSLVPHGADPFAKKVENGKIVLAKQAEKIYNMSFADDSIFKKHDYFTAIGGKPSPISFATLSFSELATDHEDNNTIINKLNTEDMELSVLIAALKLDATVITDEASFTAHIQAQLDAVASLTAEKTTLAGEVTTLKETIIAKEGEVATLTAEKTTLSTERDEAMKFKDKAIEVETGKRTEAKRLYNVIKADKADAAFLTSLDTMELSAVEVLMADYATQVETLMPLSCVKCGSKEVTRASGKVSTASASSEDLRTTIQNKAVADATKAFAEMK